MTRSKSRIKGSAYFYGRAVAACALVVLFLFIFMIAAYNVILVTDNIRKNITIQVFINDDLPADDIRKIESDIWSIPGVSGVEYIDKDQALNIMMDAFGEELFSELKGNPLPSSFEVKLDRNSLGWENVQRMANIIQLMPGVGEVDYGGDLLKNIDRIRELVIIAAVVFLGLISLSSTAAVSNAAQLLYYRNSEKIQVERMLGATKFYLSKPLIMRGIFIGLASTALAALLTIVIYYVVNDSLLEIDFIPPHFIGAAFIWFAFWGGYGGYHGFIHGGGSE